jgi:hypothetical protein
MLRYVFSALSWVKENRSHVFALLFLTIFVSYHIYHDVYMPKKHGQIASKTKWTQGSSYY